MRTLKRIMQDYNKKYSAVIAYNKTYPQVRKQTPDWKETLLPVIKSIEAATQSKREGEELRQFGLRAHVPVTFLKDGKEFIYIDFSNSTETGMLFITDYTQPVKRQYRSGTIGEINGFNLQQIRFEPTQKPEEVAEYVKNNIQKFLIDSHV